MQVSLMLMAFLAGLGLTFQVGLNAAIRNGFGSAGMAALTNFLVGTVALVAFLVVTRVPIPARASFGAIPSWAWFGGLFGAFYVATSTIVGPKLGATTLLALTVLGQLAASLLVDQFGWLGFPQQDITLTRLLGSAMLFGGVLLVTR